MLKLQLTLHFRGRQAAEEVDAYLVGNTRLAFQGGIPKRSWLPPTVSKPQNAISETLSERAGMDSEAVTVAAGA